MNSLIFFVIGLLGLWLGSTLVVEFSKRLALRFNISQTLIGLTVISIGTSLPEIMTNIMSGLKISSGGVQSVAASGIAIGTNIGSDLTQITFILGVTAIIGTIYASKKTLFRDGGMVLLSIVLVFIFGLTGGRFSFFEGITVVVLYIIYLYVISKDDHVLDKISNEMNYEHGHKKEKKGMLKDSFFVAVGIGILIYASHLVVSGALELSELWGVSESFIGVMIVGVGTGLPELSTAITGILKKADGISLGTLIGSNITDPMFSLGLGAIASGSFGLLFEKNLLFFDIPYWFIVSIIAFLLLGRKMKLGRKEGIALLSFYVLFVILKIRFFM